MLPSLSKIKDLCRISFNRYYPLFFFALLLVSFFCSYKYIRISYNPNPLLDISRKFVKTQDVIINIQPLRDFYGNLQSKYPNSDISLYFEFLNTGANISLNKNLRMWPASLPKVPVAIIIMRKIEDGDLSLSTKIRIKDSDLNKNSGDLYKNGSGTEYTVEELLRHLLVYSDNTADIALLRQITKEEEEDFIMETGLEELFSKEGGISAKEYSRVLRSLYESSYLEPKNSEKILDLMSQSAFTDFMSRGIPRGIRFARKWGIDFDRKTYLEAGIVYLPDRPYMVVAIISGVGIDSARDFFYSVSSSAYNYLSRVRK
ncbi:MAG: serine hydrolase [Candidatus Pacebacteria bacterium]|nr:serine hydrolase [Candidatus Paceibacterota bacterium]